MLRERSSFDLGGGGGFKVNHFQGWFMGIGLLEAGAHSIVVALRSALPWGPGLGLYFEQNLASITFRQATSSSWRLGGQ